MELSEWIYYLGTFLFVVSYCCRTFWLRIFQIIGGIFNTSFALMILESSPSARAMIISNIIFMAINIFQAFRERKLEKLNSTKTDKALANDN